MQVTEIKRLSYRAALIASVAIVFTGAESAQAQVSAGSVDVTAKALTPRVMISNPGTSETSVDTTNITGVGQMVIRGSNGGIASCTGTLINPRTVIFAAHCVNEQQATSYGSNSGGTPIVFGFEANLRSEAPGAPDELLEWYSDPSGRKTNVASSLYNVDQVM